MTAWWRATVVLWIAFSVVALLWMNEGSFDCHPTCSTWDGVLGWGGVLLGAAAVLSLVVAAVLSFIRRVR